MKSRILMYAILLAGSLTGCTSPVLGTPGNIRTFRGRTLDPANMHVSWNSQSADGSRYLTVHFNAGLHRITFQTGSLEVVDSAGVECERLGREEVTAKGGGASGSVYSPATRTMVEFVGGSWFGAGTGFGLERRLDEPAVLEFPPQTMDRPEPMRIDVPLGPERVTLFLTATITNAADLRSEPTADGFRQMLRSSSRMRLGVDLVAGGGRFVERFMMGPDVSMASEQQYDFTRGLLTWSGGADHLAEGRIRLAEAAGAEQVQVAEYQDLGAETWSSSPRTIPLSR